MRLHNGHLPCVYFEDISPCFQNQVNFFFKTSLSFSVRNTHLLHPTKFRDRVPRQAVPGRCLWSSAADQWDRWPAAISTPSQYMDVSKNSGYPKSSIKIGFSIINHPFWGTPIFGNTHMTTMIDFESDSLGGYGKTEAGKSTVCLTFLRWWVVRIFHALMGFHGSSHKNYYHIRTFKHLQTTKLQTRKTRDSRSFFKPMMYIYIYVLNHINVH